MTKRAEAALIAVEAGILPDPEPEPMPPTASRVDWKELFGADFGAAEWTAGRLMTKGQQIALVGDGKAGKSVFCQEWAWRMSAGKPFLGDKAREPMRVLYLDAENGQPDLQDRFLSFGADPDTLAELVYESFPGLPPLDTVAGGAALLALVEEIGPAVVFIDTVSRFISGNENDSDTWLSLYRNTLMHLKSMGIGSVRLDHFGKDRERGARGNSAKTQDIDHVWELKALERGTRTLRLQRTHTRTGIGEDFITMLRLGEKIQVKVGDEIVEKWKPNGTRHVLPDTAVLGEVEAWVKKLDEANIPASWGRDKVRNECANRGITPLPRTEILGEVIKLRKTRQNLSRTPGDRFIEQTCPTCGDSFDISAGHTCTGQVGDSSETATARPVPLPPSLGRGQDGQPSPACTECGNRIDPIFAADGATVCTTCRAKSGRCESCGFDVDSVGHETNCGTS